jgi:hypothetical protein
VTLAPRPGTGGKDQPRLGNWAVTDPEHRDPHLRGRRYAIPFARVWSAALTLAGGGLRRWSVESSDEIEGVIRARTVTLVFRFVDDVEIRVGLDRDAQTRVDLSSRSRKGKWDLGKNGRRIRKFLKRLDRELAAPPELILPPEEGALPPAPEDAPTAPGS